MILANKGRSLELASMLFSVSLVVVKMLDEEECEELKVMVAFEQTDKHLSIEQSNEASTATIQRLIKKGLAEVCPDCGGVRPTEAAWPVVSSIEAAEVMAQEASALNN